MTEKKRIVILGEGVLRKMVIPEVHAGKGNPFRDRPSRPRLSRPLILRANRCLRRPHIRHPSLAPFSLERADESQICTDDSG